MRAVVGERRLDCRHTARQLRPHSGERIQQECAVVRCAGESPHHLEQLRRQLVGAQCLRHTLPITHPPQARDGMVSGGDDPCIQASLARHVEGRDCRDCIADRLKCDAHSGTPQAWDCPRHLWITDLRREGRGEVEGAGARWRMELCVQSRTAGLSISLYHT